MDDTPRLDVRRPVPPPLSLLGVPLADWLLLALVVAGLLWIWSMPPHVTFDWDEGFNLMKARLLNDGYSLYTQTWSDQPPLMTYLLAGWARLVGDTPTAGRVLVLLLVAAGLWAGAVSLRLTVGGVSDLVFVLCMVGCWRFLKYAVAVMVGLPAISLALLAMVPLVLHLRRPRWYWPILSGALIAASMQTKLFTGMMLPMLVAMLWIVGERRLKNLAVFAGVGLAVFLAIGAGMGWEPSQVISTHLNDTRDWSFRLWANTKMIAGVLGKSGHVMLAALAGFALLWKAGDVRWRIPGLWLAAAIPSLVLARPMWAHHGLMLLIPLAAIAAIGLHDIHRTRRWWSGLIAVVILLPPVVRLAQARELVEDAAGMISPRAIAAVVSTAPRTNWLFADAPIYGSFTGLPCPPELAVLSAKRIRSGFDEPKVIGTLERYQPEQIVLRRFGERERILGPEFRLWLASRYVVTYERGLEEKVYLRRDLAGAAADPDWPISDRDWPVNPTP